LRIDSLSGFKASSITVNRENNVKPERFVENLPPPESITPEAITNYLEAPQAPTVLVEYAETNPEILEEGAFLQETGEVDFDDVETCDDFAETDDVETEEEEEEGRKIEGIVNAVDDEEDPTEDKKENLEDEEIMEDDNILEGLSKQDKLQAA